ncbi:hypothetical protein BH10BAC5_BH10BAC5_27730 [soil metagenome]
MAGKYIIIDHKLRTGTSIHDVVVRSTVDMIDHPLSLDDAEFKEVINNPDELAKLIESGNINTSGIDDFLDDFLNGEEDKEHGVPGH